MKYVSGLIYAETGFYKGYISIKDNVIINFGKGKPPQTASLKGLITPAFYNMHTHIGDAFIRNRNIELPRDIIKLVAPPNGLKHQLLQSATDDEIIDGMKQSIQEMSRTGTEFFCDFRENGTKGLSLIKNALEDSTINSCILSRPKIMSYDSKEIDILLNESNGIGLSSVQDWDYQEIKQIAIHTKKKDKIFSIHVSERIQENIHEIINLNPDFVVHMTKASKKDLMLLKEADIPIVICPQSNHFFNNAPPLNLMKEIGNNLMVGSDNAMFHSLDLIEEINQINRFTPGVFTIGELFHMIIRNPRKVLNSNDVIHRTNLPRSYLVLDIDTLEPLLHLKCDREG